MNFDFAADYTPHIEAESIRVKTFLNDRALHKAQWDAAFGMVYPVQVIDITDSVKLIVL